MRLDLRPADPGDAKRYFVWANDPVTRAQSYNPARISWAEHKAWFSKRLKDGRVRMYVALAPRPAGQIRFEKVRSGVVHVGLSLAAEQRGKGLGALLIRAGCRRAVRELRVKRVLAYIKKDNAASRAAFGRAGFRRVRDIRRSGTDSVLLAWEAP